MQIDEEGLVERPKRWVIGASLGPEELQRLLDIISDPDAPALPALDSLPQPNTSHLIGRLYEQMYGLIKTGHPEKVAQYLYHENSCVHAMVLMTLRAAGSEGVIALHRVLDADVRSEMKQNAATLLGMIEARGTDERRKGEGTKRLKAMVQRGTRDEKLSAYTAIRCMKAATASRDLMECFDREKQTDLRAAIIREYSLLGDKADPKEIIKRIGLSSKNGAIAIDELPREVAFVLHPDFIASNLGHWAVKELAYKFGHIDHHVYQSSGDALAHAETLLQSIGVATEPLLTRVSNAMVPGLELTQLEAEALDRRELLKLKYENGEINIGKYGAEGRWIDELAELTGARGDILFAAIRSLQYNRTNSWVKTFSPIAYRNSLHGRFLMMSRDAFQSGIEKYDREHNLFFEQCPVPLSTRQTMKGHMLLERLAIDTEWDGDRAIERTLMFASRWESLLKIHGQTISGSPRDRRQLIANLAQDGERKTWAFQVLDPEILSKMDRFIEEKELENKRYISLSLGSRAALRIYVYNLYLSSSADDSKISDLWQSAFETILDEERAAKERGLPSVGIEFQEEKIAYSSCYGWKEALKCFGIASPQRKEFKYIVEAALPPTYSPCAYGLLTKSLCELGFFSEELHRTRMHLSIGEVIPNGAQYLAFGLWALDQAPPELIDRERWHRNWAGTFSQGLIVHNPDSVSPISGKPTGSPHTEIRIRSLLVGDEKAQSAGEEIRDMVRCAQELARLGNSQETESIAKWTAYCTEMQNLASHSRFGTLSMFGEDWGLGTADAGDVKLFNEVGMTTALYMAEQHLGRRPDEHTLLRSNVRKIIERCSGVSIFSSSM